MLMAIRDADTAGREETGQSTFRAPPPVDPSPFPSSQKGFSCDRELIRDVVFARPSGFRDRENQSNVGGINVLASRQTDRPQQAAFAQSLTERPAGPGGVVSPASVSDVSFGDKCHSHIGLGGAGQWSAVASSLVSEPFLTVLGS
jgi:hypothetical protein